VAVVYFIWSQLQLEHLHNLWMKLHFIFHITNVSLHFNDHYPGGPCLAGIQNASVLDFIGAKGDGGGDNNWSYKTCKDPVKMSPPTNQHPVFLQAGCPSCCPTNTEGNHIAVVSGANFLLPHFVLIFSCNATTCYIE